MDYLLKQKNREDEEIAIIRDDIWSNLLNTFDSVNEFQAYIYEKIYNNNKFNNFNNIDIKRSSIIELVEYRDNLWNNLLNTFNSINEFQEYGFDKFNEISDITLYNNII